MVIFDKPVSSVRVLAHQTVATLRGVRYDAAMSFASIDHWIGRTLFVPLIVKLCQTTRQSQFAISRTFWFLAAVDGFYYAETMFSSVLWGAVSLLMMVTAVTRADSPTRSMMWFRLIAIAALMIDVVIGIGTSAWFGIEFWVLVLIAEYASTIATIPPIKTKTSITIPTAQSRR